MALAGYTPAGSVCFAVVGRRRRWNPRRGWQGRRGEKRERATMAQPHEQARANQSAQSAASNGRAQSGATPGERPSLLGVLGRVLSLRTAPTDTKRGRWSNFSKMLFVLLIFMFAIQLVYYLAELLDTKYPGLLFNQPLVPYETFPLLCVIPRR